MTFDTLSNLILVGIRFFDPIDILRVSGGLILRRLIVLAGGDKLDVTAPKL